MAAPKRTKTQRARQVKEACERHAAGESMRSIAASFGLSLAQIAYDITQAKKEWKRDREAALDKLRDKELAKLAQLEAVAWEGYQKSIQDKKTNFGKKGSDGEIVSQSIRVEEQNGNPAYLDRVAWCINKRAQLLGLDAPIKSEVSGPGGGPVEIQHPIRALDERPDIVAKLRELSDLLDDRS